MRDDSPYFWLALRSVPQVGNVTCRRLVEYFGSPKKALHAQLEELSSLQGVSAPAAASLVGFNWRQAADRAMQLFEKSGAAFVTILQEDYPLLLKEIPDPPPFFFLKGKLPDLSNPVAVVGSRLASEYGISVTFRFSRELAERGVPIISGLASGVDSAAHRGALQASGATVGVLGCGIDVVYPPENRRLFAEMETKGSIVSEFLPGTPPDAPNFPRRNRIISGMARGVLVVEAMEKSGSLITARFALEQGRDVYAVPGNINCRASRGTNSLIKQGAKLVESIEDILVELPAKGMPLPIRIKERRFALQPEEERLCALLESAPSHIDELKSRSGLTVSVLSAMLLRLELQGAVVQMPGKIFALS